VAIWSSHRLRFAIPIECPSTRRIRASIVSIARERRPTRSIPGNSCATNCRNRILGEPLSTGTPSARHRKYRWQPDAGATAVGRLWDWGCTLAAVVASAAKVHRANAMRTGSVVVTSWAPPCKEKNPEKLSSLRSPFTNGSVLG
jgi:hypothetical protein